MDDKENVRVSRFTKWLVVNRKDLTQLSKNSISLTLSLEHYMKENQSPEIFFRLAENQIKVLKRNGVEDVVDTTLERIQEWNIEFYSHISAFLHIANGVGTIYLRNILKFLAEVPKNYLTSLSVGEYVGSRSNTRIWDLVEEEDLSFVFNQLSTEVPITRRKTLIDFIWSMLRNKLSSETIRSILLQWDEERKIRFMEHLVVDASDRESVSIMLQIFGSRPRSVLNRFGDKAYVLSALILREDIPLDLAFASFSTIRWQYPHDMEDLRHIVKYFRIHYKIDDRVAKRMFGTCSSGREILCMFQVFSETFADIPFVPAMFFKIGLDISLDLIFDLLRNETFHGHGTQIQDQKFIRHCMISAVRKQSDFPLSTDLRQEFLKRLGDVPNHGNVKTVLFRN